MKNEDILKRDLNIVDDFAFKLAECWLLKKEYVLTPTDCDDLTTALNNLLKEVRRYVKSSSIHSDTVESRKS